MMPSNTPVIIGVGDIKNRSTAVADAKEPATLMLEAIQKAISDTASSSNTHLQSAIDSIGVVKTWTWPYPDLPGLLAEKLGVDQNLKWKRYSEHGGDKPGKLFDEAAKRIAKGECKVAIVTGGEALASCTCHMLSKVTLRSLLTTDCTSVGMRSCKEAASARLDSSLRSCRFRLHTNRSRPRK
jgi:acetyl-CoA acetyltransferase